MGLAQLRYAFLPCTATRTTQCDLNGNQLVDSWQELGAFNSTQGGGGFVRIDRDLTRPTSNEISLNLEREISAVVLGPRVVCLQEHAERLGRDRRRPRRRPTRCRSPSPIPGSTTA